MWFCLSARQEHIALQLPNCHSSIVQKREEENKSQWTHIERQPRLQRPWECLLCSFQRTETEILLRRISASESSLGVLLWCLLWTSQALKVTVQPPRSWGRWGNTRLDEFKMQFWPLVFSSWYFKCLWFLHLGPCSNCHLKQGSIGKGSAGKYWKCWEMLGREVNAR